MNIVIWRARTDYVAPVTPTLQQHGAGCSFFDIANWYQGFLHVVDLPVTRGSDSERYTIHIFEGSYELSNSQQK